MGRRSNPIDEFFHGLDRLITGLTNEFVERTVDFVKWFVVQGILDAFANTYKLGFAVDGFFILFTGYGLFADVEEARSAKSLVRLLLAVFGLIIDLWWTFGI